MSYILFQYFILQTLGIFNRDLPETTIELSVQGSDAVMFGQGAFAGIVDMRRIAVKGAKLVVFRQFAAVSLNPLNLFLDVEDCAVLRFEKSAFMSLKGKLSKNDLLAHTNNVYCQFYYAVIEILSLTQADVYSFFDNQTIKSMFCILRLVEHNK